MYMPPKDFAFYMKALCIWEDQKLWNGDNIIEMYTVILTFHVYKTTTEK